MKKLLGKFRARRKKAPKLPPEAVQTAVSEADREAFRGPSPNPHTNMILADLALRGGASLARHSIEKGLLGTRYAPEKAKAILKSRTLGETLIHTAIAKLATKSVPGAIIVGGGILAKTLYDRRKGQRAAIDGELKMEQKAAEGSEPDS